MRALTLENKMLINLVLVGKDISFLVLYMDLDFVILVILVVLVVLVVLIKRKNQNLAVLVVLVKRKNQNLVVLVVLVKRKNQNLVVLVDLVERKNLNPRVMMFQNSNSLMMRLQVILVRKVFQVIIFQMIRVMINPTEVMKILVAILMLVVPASLTWDGWGWIKLAREVPHTDRLVLRGPITLVISSWPCGVLLGVGRRPNHPKSLTALSGKIRGTPSTNGRQKRGQTWMKIGTLEIDATWNTCQALGWSRCWSM
jgi:hypothetical protein